MNKAIDDKSGGHKKPNLLFVLVDQMRYSAMGYPGLENVYTPNLDRFASEGAFFRNAVSNIPVCTPARACMLTGRYPLGNTVLVNNSILPNDMPSIGKILKKEGFSTGYIGKWHLGGEAFIGQTEYNGGHAGYIPPGEMRHGFDYWAVHHCHHSYWNACYYLDEPEPIQISGWEPDTQTDLAIDFISKNSSSKENDPFALFVSWGAPHTPFTAPDEFLEQYDEDKIEFFPNVEFSETILHCDSGVPEKAKGNPEKTLRNFFCNYYAAISSLDHCFGRLLDELERLGIADDTIVVFTSDHGDMMGSQGQMHKLQPWDESVRIPFMVRYPEKILKGKNIDFPFNLPDILPTLLGLMNVDCPSGVEGVDCSGFMLGDNSSMKEPDSSFLIWPCNACTWGKKWTYLKDSGWGGIPVGFLRPYRGVRSEEFTYVQDREGDWMLYDNQRDPWQMNNLIKASGKNQVPAHLKTMLSEWLEKTGDTFADTDFYLNQIDLETGLVKEPEKLVNNKI
jgi:arylsulfatase A-like enzyme